MPDGASRGALGTTEGEFRVIADRVLGGFDVTGAGGYRHVGAQQGEAVMAGGVLFAYRRPRFSGENFYLRVRRVLGAGE